jgi:hypothetical protein
LYARRLRRRLRRRVLRFLRRVFHLRSLASDPVSSPFRPLLPAAACLRRPGIMSYQYLFKYIIIGDTGFCFFSRCFLLLPILRRSSFPLARMILVFCFLLILVAVFETAGCSCLRFRVDDDRA